MSIASVIGRHARHPHGWLGRVLARVMTKRTRAAFPWTADLCQLQPTHQILEVGFGTGASLGIWAERAPAGHVVGVEASEEMLRLAGRMHRDLVAAGRISLCRTDAGELPLEASRFDRAISINMVYILKEPQELFGRLFRVLKPGGLAAITFPLREEFENFPPAKTSGFHLHDYETLEAQLGEVGFEHVQRHINRELPFPSNCLVGTKPA